MKRALPPADYAGCPVTVTEAVSAGEVLELPQHDGSIMRLRKLHADYDPTDRVSANALSKSCCGFQPQSRRAAASSMSSGQLSTMR